MSFREGGAAMTALAQQADISVAHISRLIAAAANGRREA